MATRKITFLRISYWTGAIVDALAIIPLLSAKVAGMVQGTSNFNPGNDYMYAMAMAASLMAGWVSLLGGSNPSGRTSQVIIAFNFLMRRR